MNCKTFEGLRVMSVLFTGEFSNLVRAKLHSNHREGTELHGETLGDPCDFPVIAVVIAS